MLGVDHDDILLLSTPFPTIPMFGKHCCCDVIVLYVGNKRCCSIVLYCIVLYCKSEQFMITHLQSQKKTEYMINPIILFKNDFVRRDFVLLDSVPYSA